MPKDFWDYDSSDFCMELSDDMAVDSQGNMLMKLSDDMVMDLESGEVHFISGWTENDND